MRIHEIIRRCDQECLKTAKKQCKGLREEGKNEAEIREFFREKLPRTVIEQVIKSK